MEDKDRYQNQPRWIKIVRWVRWKPWFALRASIDILRYRRFSFDCEDCEISIWSLRMSEAEMRTGHYFTMDEIREELG